ncbi:MAG: alpha/beta hydrolase [Beijerinckiaceae bacterium]
MSDFRPRPSLGCVSRRAAIAGLAAGFSGCAAEAVTGGMTSSLTRPPALDPTLLAVTMRQPTAGATKAPWFGAERALKPILARARMRRPGGGFGSELIGSDWTVAGVSLEETAFAQALGAAVADRETLLYVHGYKESFESAARGAITISEGISFQGEPLLFSWPSKAQLLDYGYDRESALYSRDGLEDTLLALLADGGAARLHIVAHSMGTLLTLETLRQIWARHGDAFATRLGAIVLASADIDLDLFGASLQRLRSLTPRITVISSTGDRALEVSRRMAGGVARAGGASREQLERLGVKVVDTTEYGGWSLVRHDLFLSDPDVRQVIRRAVERS